LAAYGDLFAPGRLDDVTAAMEEASGEDRRCLAKLRDFLARGLAMRRAGSLLDRRLDWECTAWVVSDDRRVPLSRVPDDHSRTVETRDRRSLAEARSSLLHDHRGLAEDFVAAHREALGSPGDGSHTGTLEALAGVDLHALAKAGDGFLAETRDFYFDLLGWYLPRRVGVPVAEACSEDAYRLHAVGSDTPVATAGAHDLLRSLGGMGLEPLRESGFLVEWDADTGPLRGGVCGPVRVPGRVLLAVSRRADPAAMGSALAAYGTALHHVFTDPSLPLEDRRLGDGGVAEGSGQLFRSLAWSPPWVRRAYGSDQARSHDAVRLEVLLALLAVRRDIARLRFELAFYAGEAGPPEYADLLLEATGFRHDPREAVWRVEVECDSARRLRAAQLGAAYALILRDRFDEDWFRNPATGAFLRQLFVTGRRSSAEEIATRLTGSVLGFAQLTAQLTEVFR
jgi:hypothetical protein